MKYFLLIFKHKWFVFLAGLKLSVSFWRLLVHDLSKFLPSELSHYQRQFFGKKDQPQKFIKTWIYHKNRNRHHWEYWVPRTGHNRCEPPYKDNEPIPMPVKYAKEMVADWLGASRAYEGKWPESYDTWEWMKKNFDSIRVHELTREYLKSLLHYYFVKRR